MTVQPTYLKKEFLINTNAAFFQGFGMKNGERCIIFKLESEESYPSTVYILHCHGVALFMCELTINEVECSFNRC